MAEAAGAKKQTVTVAGRTLTISNLDKVIYPETGTTKGDVLRYYAEVAPLLIAAARDRPATRKRWVHGVGTAEHPGTMFFQKNLEDSAPDWVPRGTIHHKNHDNDYPLVNDAATLAWLGQIAALELHVPQWRFGPDGTPHHPDRLVLDLDPGPGAGLAECAQVARWCRAILADMGLDPVPVSSGSKGLHLYAGLDGKQSSAAVSEVAHELARALEADHPDLVVSDMKKSLRDGKVLLDWSQNNPNKTTIVPYSLRGRPTPTVAFPRTWRELAGPGLAQVGYEEALRRIRRRKDPFAVVAALGAGQDAGHGAGQAEDVTGRAEDGGGPAGKLRRYRQKRTAGATPEPVPEDNGPAPAAAAADAGGEPIFVIQRHDARRLHYDFRLEHEGVLVSWALPRGVPTDTGKNHLAVQTEDHPMDYATFAGTIPKGQYGAGTVEIWDTGTFELEKWRPDKEVIAVLHGTKAAGLGAARRFALIHTGGEGSAAKNWLIHLMKDQPGHAPPAGRAPAARPRTAAPGTAASGTAPSGTAPAGSGPDGTAAGPRPPRPMVAEAAAADAVDPAGTGWSFELKWDGIRALAVVADGTASLYSRNG
ncbi:MAG TPA: non-homologous end-joining DNA ligase, partial [Micrococcaceae bacterium]